MYLHLLPVLQTALGAVLIVKCATITAVATVATYHPSEVRRRDARRVLKLLLRRSRRVGRWCR